MEAYEARLESYGPLKGSKKRTSTAKSAKGPKWPHSSPTPASLAKAGFFYDPNEASGDRVTCCLCQTVLDGWEADDDPITEHFNYSPECGLAIHAKIEQDVERGVSIELEPNSEEMVAARRATFRDLWPHEKKRGWICKTQKMAEAGWYYCPTSESDDFVKCAYCSLSLDGWEPKDKPYDEHQRRSANCIVFTSANSNVKAKSSRAKKSGASKASRLSVQSLTAATNETTLADVTMAEGDTVLTTATDLTEASTTASKPKKAPRGRKAKSKSKASAVASTDSTLASSMIEPEDDDFDVKVVVPIITSKPARKRKSEEITAAEEDEQNAAVPKRRATRARSSTIQPETIDKVTDPTLEDISMADSEIDPPKSAPKRKGKQATRSRAASSKRKASATSTTSQSSLQESQPIDDELEAVLEADLARPLTNEDATTDKPALRSRATSRSQTKKAAAAATAKKESQEAAANPGPMQGSIEDMSTFLNDNESLTSMPQLKNPKQRTARKHQDTSSSTTKYDSTLDEANQLGEAIAEESTVASATASKGRQPSRKASRQPARAKAGISEPLSSSEVVQQASSVASADVTMIHDAAKDAKETSKATKSSKRNVSASKLVSKNKAAVSKQESADQGVAGAEIEAPSKIPDKSASGSSEVEAKQCKAKTVGRPRTKLSEEIVPQPVHHPATESVSGPQSDAANDPTPAATPAKKAVAPATRQIPSPTPSMQSSDAENHPPSSRPSATRPPLVAPTSPVATRVPLVATTPTATRTNLNSSKLATTFPWTSIDLDYALAGTPGAAGQENLDFSVKFADAELASPEKKMTVEQWIKHQATLSQNRLKSECELIVQKFENEGVRALKALEGIEAED